jgi:hypothetical protein
MRVSRLLVLFLVLAPFPLAAAEEASMHSESNDLHQLLEAHQDSRWSGPAELWVDPMGNQASTSDATLTLEADGFRYTWSYEGKAQSGEFRMGDAGARWRDSWHQPEFVELSPSHDDRSLMAMEYSYPAGSGPDWGWRIRLTQRPDSTLVLAMTNIAPWGEAARAVRMVFSPESEATGEDRSTGNL